MPEQRTQTVDAFRREIGLNGFAPVAPFETATWQDPEATIVRPPEFHANRARIEEQDLDDTVIHEAKAPAAAPHAARSMRPALAGVAVAILLAGAGSWWALHRSAVVPNTTSVTPSSATQNPAPTVPPVAAPVASEPAPITTSIVPPPESLPSVPIARPPDTSLEPVPPEKKVVPRMPKASKAEHDSAPSNRAECARIFQRLSLGEDTPELRERVKSLKCQ
jgi:hypothetical protein